MSSSDKPPPTISQSQILTFATPLPKKPVQTCTVLGQRWAVHIDSKPDFLNLRLQYTGPHESMTLKDYRVEVVGTPQSVSKRSKRNLHFIADGKTVDIKHVVPVDQLESFVLNNTLSVKLTCSFQIPSEHDATTQSVLSHVGVVGSGGKTVRFDEEPNVDKLKKKVEKLTRERNSLHKSLHELQKSDSGSATVSSSFPTQPEVVTRFEGFQMVAESIVLDLYEELGDSAHDQVTRVLCKAALLMKEAAKKQMKFVESRVLKQIPSSDGAQLSKLAEEFVLRAERATFQWERDFTKEEDAYVASMNKLFPSAMQKQQASYLKDFARFVYLFSKYQLITNTMVLDWALVGKTVAFSSKKHQGMEGKITSGAKAVVVLPPLTVEQTKGGQEVCVKTLVIAL